MILNLAVIDVYWLKLFTYLREKSCCHGGHQISRRDVSLSGLGRGIATTTRCTRQLPTLVQIETLQGFETGQGSDPLQSNHLR